MSWWTKVVDYWTGTEQKKVRARTKKGQYVADDKSWHYYRCAFSLCWHDL